MISEVKVREARDEAVMSLKAFLHRHMVVLGEIQTLQRALEAKRDEQREAEKRIGEAQAAIFSYNAILEDTTSLEDLLKSAAD